MYSCASGHVQLFVSRRTMANVGHTARGEQVEDHQEKGWREERISVSVLHHQFVF